MQNQNEVTEAINVPNEPSTPFVNEECGDTMWDEVLTQNEPKP